MHSQWHAYKNQGNSNIKQIITNTPSEPFLWRKPHVGMIQEADEEQKLL